MAQEEIIKQFGAAKIRVHWDEEQEKYYFSIVDVVRVLTEQNDYLTARKYWNKLKQRLILEGNETVTNCHQLKMTAEDGKQRFTDVADTEQILRLVQSVPSKKAEPLKRWLAQIGQERLNQMQDPERSLQQMVADYRRLGHDEAWINQRIKSIQIRKGLTDEWQRGGITEDKDFAFLTDIISTTWSGMSTRQYKNFKGLREGARRNALRAKCPDASPHGGKGTSIERRDPCGHAGSRSHRPNERTGKRVGAVTIEKRTTLTGSPLRLLKLN